MLEELSNNNTTLGATSDADNIGPLKGVNAWVGNAMHSPSTSPASMPLIRCRSDPCKSINALQQGAGSIPLTEHRDPIQSAGATRCQVDRQRALAQPHHAVPDLH